MRTLLIIGYVWPEPNSSAAGWHMLSIIRLFKRQSWKVIFATPAQKTEHNFDLSTEEIETKTIEINHSNFDGYIKSIQPNLVLFDRFMMEEQFGWRVAENCPDAIRLLDTEDLQCLRGARQLAHKEGRIFSNADLNSDLAKREIASIYRCDLSLIISDFEMSLLTEHFKIDPNLLVHIPFMLELDKRAKQTPTYSARQNFVTIGNLRHAPNWDSILYLQEIWPFIRKALPTAELHIYGAYTPPKATALNNPKTGFLIKDRADNVIDIMQHARVCLSPIRFGAGIKGKFVDAMQVNLPSVTTPIGAEGMAPGNIWPGMIEDNPEAIAKAAIALYQNESLWLEKSELCAKLIKSVYDRKIIEKKLIDRVYHLLENRQAHREKNFIGSMLNYHSLRSTKYMSKWIEEKNKPL
jgi:glycosyltransferase involved in cell wall biosynthesis